jgi:hyperosmotically inducible periplasmic protein
MRHFSKILLTLLTLLFNTQTLLATTLEDESITETVKQLLIKENGIPDATIDVLTKDRIVYLNGTVDTKLQANKIIELASSVENVVDVNDKNLKINSSSEFLADSLLTAKVKGRLKYLSLNKHIKEGYDLHVETTNKIVHIFGTVQDEKDIEVIRKIISNIVSVKEVKMNVKCR